MMPEGAGNHRFPAPVRSSVCINAICALRICKALTIVRADIFSDARYVRMVEEKIKVRVAFLIQEIKKATRTLSLESRYSV